MKTENITHQKPPYVAYKTFTNFIASLRSSGIPDRIDRSIFPGMSGAAQSFLLAALRYLGLIGTDGTPTATLRDLVDSASNEKELLPKIVKEKYSFIFGGGFNIASATDAQLTEKFKEQGLNGSTIVKALSFFTSLCESAGITISPHLKSKRTASGGNGSPRRQNKKRKAVDEPPFTTPPPPPLDPDQHTLYLSVDKKRKVALGAPLSISNAEYKRICDWIKVTLIVDDAITELLDDSKK